MWIIRNSFCRQGHSYSRWGNSLPSTCVEPIVVVGEIGLSKRSILLSLWLPFLLNFLCATGGTTTSILLVLGMLLKLQQSVVWQHSFLGKTVSLGKFTIPNSQQSIYFSGSVWFGISICVMTQLTVLNTPFKPSVKRPFEMISSFLASSSSTSQFSNAYFPFKCFARSVARYTANAPASSAS